MKRAIWAILGVFAISGGLAYGQEARSPARKTSVTLLPASHYGEAKPASGCPTCSDRSGVVPATASVGSASVGRWTPGYDPFQDWIDQHECAPYGCPKPIGCGNLFTELKFLFGSCRQFFGNAESTVGHHRATRERYGPGYYWPMPYPNGR